MDPAERRPDGAWAGIPVDHVVAVLAHLPSRKVQVGSGYLVGPRTVVTAEHCTRDKLAKPTEATAVPLTVVRKVDGRTAAVRSRLTAPKLDVAVLDLKEAFTFESPSPVRFGRVDRAHGDDLFHCKAIGYPIFQYDSIKEQRNSAQMDGTIRTSDQSETGQLLLRDPGLVGVGADATAESGADSPWRGLSGALVFHCGLALGVVIEHHPRQGPSSVLLTAVDTLASSTDPHARAVAAALELPEAAMLPVAREPVPVTPEVARPSLLPIDDAVLVGRDDAVAALSDRLTPGRDGPTPLVVVTGAPGVGKSALALRVAHGLADRYVDGQLFVNLRGADSRALDPARVLADFLRALGVGETAIPATPEDRARLYRSRLWGHRVLVVLDNAGSEEQVRSLLPGAPSCAVLVTSRKRLPGLGGHSETLPELCPAASLDLLRRIVGDERVDRDVDAAAEITRSCEYLPLAVRIAGARLALRPGLSTRAFARRLADERGRLDELETPDSAVRATLELSVQDLDPADREAFVWLGLLEGAEFTAWRLAALLDVAQRLAERRIESLLQGEMITTSSSEEGVGERFRMHDLLRLFARELVEQEQPEDTRKEALRRTTRSFLYLALGAAAALEPGEDFSRLTAPPLMLRDVEDPDLVDEIHERPLSWFSQERQTMVIAVDRMAAQGSHDLVIGLVRSMTTFFDYHAHWDDWSTTVGLALTSAHHCGNHDAEAALLRSLSRLHRYRGDLDSSDELINRSLAVAKAAHDEAAVAESLVDAIRLGWYRGRHAEAHDFCDEALRHFSSVGGRYGQARCWASIALVLREEGRSAEAVERCEEALEIFRDIGDRRWVAATLTALADALRDQNRPADAEERIREALPLLHELGFRWWEAVTLRTLGLVRADQGHLDEAVASLRAGVLALHDLNMEWWESVARVSLAEVLRRAGHLSSALDELRPAESALRKRKDRRWTAIATVLRVRTTWEDHRDVAIAELNDAQRALAECGDHEWLATAEQLAADMSSGSA